MEPVRSRYVRFRNVASSMIGGGSIFACRQTVANRSSIHRARSADDIRGATVLTATGSAAFALAHAEPNINMTSTRHGALTSMVPRLQNHESKSLTHNTHREIRLKVRVRVQYRQNVFSVKCVCLDILESF